jgi:hypothetical protein
MRVVGSQTVLPQQGFLEDAGHRQQILKYLPPDTADAVQRAWDGMRSRPGEEEDINVQRWNRLVQQCAKVCLPRQHLQYLVCTVLLSAWPLPPQGLRLRRIPQPT